MPSSNTTTTSGTPTTGWTDAVMYTNTVNDGVFVDTDAINIALNRARRLVTNSNTEEQEDSTSLEKAKETMKKRHLSKNERERLHNPKRDWLMTGKGEICRSSSVLVVDDLVDMCR